MRPKFPAWPAETRAQFLGFVRQCFAQKRKTLVNNLGSSYGREHVARALAALGLPPTARAEGLALEKFAELLGHLK
jgi:16S rRNA (adenine1518-N6/adenine1519-N6)-dimethyltransferase